MTHDAARAGRSSRFHSSGSERTGRSHSAPAVDYAVYDEYDDDFDDLDLDDDSAGAAGGRHSLSALADGLIDDLVPPEIDWRHIVRRHPWPTLFLAGLGGYLLGRSQGKTLVRAVSALAVARVESEVLGRIEDEFG